MYYLSASSYLPESNFIKYKGKPMGQKTCSQG